MNDAELRGYLLGQMSPADAERLEERILDDEELFRTLQSVEDDLIDEHTRGALNAAEQQRFLERYGNLADRLTFARAMAKRTAPPKVIPFPSRRFVPWAAAAGIALAIGGTTLVTEVEAPTRAPTVRLRAPEPGSTGPTVSLALALGTSRSAQGSEEVALPLATSVLRIRLRLDPADRFDEYAVELKSPTDQVIWREGHLSASTLGNEFGIDAVVPAALLGSGAHELAVRGIRKNTAPEDLGFQVIRVRRSP